ncbi:MAG TPA: acyl-CoA dehydrogenase family protein [Candidatus Limnocylindria bacterium]|jgi:indole-3-acetate monooxygenase
MATVTESKPTRHASVLEAVRALAPKITARAAEIERARRIPRDLIRDLTAAGCFRMMVPRSHGGGGFDLPSAMSVVEELARADGSVAWVTMNLAGNWVNLGSIPRATFDALYAGGPDVLIGGVFAPSGTVASVDGGYRVSGRWAFSSGCEDSQWLFANCMDAQGPAPQPRTVLFAPDQIRIEDTWSVSGLCGTGSHHLIAADVLVPAERTCLPFSDPPCLDEPLVRMPMPPVFAFGVASVAIGIAQGALEDIVALSAGKVPLLAHTALATNPLFQNQLGEADAKLRAARGLLYADAAAAWGTAVAGAEFTPEHRVRMRAATTWAVNAAASVADMAYHAGGGSAIYAGSPLQRRFRDVNAITQHFLVKRDTLTTVGAVLAGAEADLTIF